MASSVSPLALFNEGKLTEAITAGASAVSADPTNTSRRWAYCELLCFKGDFDRADKHLDLLVEQEPAAASKAWGFRQLLRAADARRQCFEEGRVPELLTNLTPELQVRMKICVLLRDKDNAGAEKAVAEAKVAHAPVAGNLDDKPFTDFWDLDDRMGPTVEALTVTGKHYLIPLACLEWIQFSPLKRAIDQLWRPGTFQVRRGTESGEALFPVLYPGSDKDADDAVRLGRETRWTGGTNGAPAVGLGRRDFEVRFADSTSHFISILELNRLSF